MAEKDIVLNEEQIKALGWLMKDDQNAAVTRLLNCFSCKQALINLNGRDVWAFLNGGKKLTYKTATIKKARKKEVEKSGLLCDEFQNAKKCLINIEGGYTMTLLDIDTMVRLIHKFYENADVIFGTSLNEYKENEFQIDLFILE